MVRDNSEGADLHKAVMRSDDHDPLASIRQASFGPPEKCIDLVGMLKNVQNSNLIGRLDQVTQGTFKTEGIDRGQLDQMMQGSAFSQQDKQFLGYIRDNFAQAAGAQGNPAKLTRSEMANWLGAKGRELCDQGNQGNQGGQYEQAPPPRKLKR